MPRPASESIAGPRTEGVNRESRIASGKPHIRGTTSPDMREICPPVPIEISGQPRAGLDAIARPRTKRGDCKSTIAIGEPHIHVIATAEMKQVCAAVRVEVPCAPRAAL